MNWLEIFRGQYDATNPVPIGNLEHPNWAAGAFHSNTYPWAIAEQTLKNFDDFFMCNYPTLLWNFYKSDNWADLETTSKVLVEFWKKNLDFDQEFGCTDCVKCSLKNFKMA